MEDKRKATVVEGLRLDSCTEIDERFVKLDMRHQTQKRMNLYRRQLRESTHELFRKVDVVVDYLRMAHYGTGVGCQRNQWIRLSLNIPPRPRHEADPNVSHPTALLY